MQISIRRGQTLDLTIYDDDTTAQELRFIVKGDGPAIIDETIPFTTVSGKRVAVISTDDTNHPLGTYEYMISVEYSDGSIKKYPIGDCEDCDLPDFVICEALDVS